MAIRSHYNKEGSDTKMSNWTNDLRVVMPVLKANGYCKGRTNGSHTIFVNTNGDTISLPKSINIMLWRREVKTHSLVGGFEVISKLKSK